MYRTHGTPIAVSNNGRIYIFKKRKPCRAIFDKPVLNIMTITSDGLEYIKSIDLTQCINNYSIKNAIRYESLKRGQRLYDNF